MMTSVTLRSASLDPVASPAGGSGQPIGGVTGLLSEVIPLETQLTEVDEAWAIDPVTSFPDRAALLKDLGDALTRNRVQVLAVFALTGSDEYRQNYGSLASDHVMAELARVFGDTMTPAGRCYRARQDEFWVLLDASIEESREMLDAAAAALRVTGAIARIMPAFGMAFLPSEADTPIEALAVADQELGHARRARERRKASRQGRR